MGPAFLSCGELFAITSIYATIRLRASLDLFFIVNIIFADLVCLMALEIILRFMCQITEHSEVFSKQHNLAHGLSLTKEEQRFMESCRPLKWKVGIITITRNTFPTIFNNIVIQSVINLLILM